MTTATIDLDGRTVPEPRFPDSLLRSGPPRRPGRTLAGTPLLDAGALRCVQAETLSASPRGCSRPARRFFRQLDVVYGAAGSLPKLQALHAVIYQLAEQMRRTAGNATELGQDVELWHLLIVEELVQQAGVTTGRVRFGLLPWAMAAGLGRRSGLLLALDPAHSRRIAADLADRAEHELVDYVARHPELDLTAHGCQLAADYGARTTTADLLRQLAHDQRRRARVSG